jgi:hypothetical protein
VAEHSPNGFEVAVLLQDFHGDPVAKVMRFQHRLANDPAIGLAEPPDVLAGDWAAGPASKCRSIRRLNVRVVGRRQSP